MVKKYTKTYSKASSNQYTILNYFSPINTEATSVDGLYHSPKLKKSNTKKYYKPYCLNGRHKRISPNELKKGLLNNIRKPLVPRNENISQPTAKKTLKNKKYFKKIFSKKKMKFINELNGKSVFIKIFKEDELSMTKNKILPEIQWQEIDNDIMTSDDQKERAYQKEMNWLGETINKIENNKNYLKTHLNKTFNNNNNIGKYF